MTDRVKFMLQWDMLWEVTEGRVNVAELCREFAVSRKTSYKLHTVLSRTYEVGVPSVATIGRILKRRGLIVDSRRRRSKTPRFSAPFEGCNAPNDVWCADFKGHFQTGRTRCHPLTPTVGGLSELSVWWMRAGDPP